MTFPRQLAIFCCLFVVAACQPSGGPPAAETPDETVAVESSARTPAPAPTGPRVAGALKSPLPEAFELPFGFHRLYDNTVATETGSPQRRILVEYLDVDATAVQSALEPALADKGFSGPAVRDNDGATELTFQRADGASVVITITPGRENPRNPKAQGLVHLVWSAP